MYVSDFARNTKKNARATILDVSLQPDSGYLEAVTNIVVTLTDNSTRTFEVDEELKNCIEDYLNAPQSVGQAGSFSP